MERKVLPVAAKPKHAGGLNGRPSKYHPGIDNTVYNLRLLGASDFRIAAAIKVSVDNFTAWLDRYESLREAYDNGGAKADAFVARQMYHRAVGYSHTAEKLWYNPKTDTVKRATYTEHYAPDVNAGFRWLEFRQPEMWKPTVGSGGFDPASINGQLPPLSRYGAGNRL